MMMGIYKLDGDKLTICFRCYAPGGHDVKRPTDFDARKGLRTALAIYKRQPVALRARSENIGVSRDAVTTEAIDGYAKRNGVTKYQARAILEWESDPSNAQGR
jgi:hypothetical protein